MVRWFIHSYAKSFFKGACPFPRCPMTAYEMVLSGSGESSQQRTHHKPEGYTQWATVKNIQSNPDFYLFKRNLNRLLLRSCSLLMCTLKAKCSRKKPAPLFFSLSYRLPTLIDPQPNLGQEEDTGRVWEVIIDKHKWQWNGMSIKAPTQPHTLVFK